MKTELLIKDGNKIRVLQTTETKALVFECSKNGLPRWEDITALDGYVECEEEPVIELEPEEQKTAYERFGIIAPVLSFLGDSRTRKQIIKQMAAEHNISGQTIKNYILMYLKSMNIAALAPKRKEQRELTDDEKNFRWALNKFYYTPLKEPLTYAYTKMLQEKYCDKNGELIEDYPSFDRFRYYYRKNRKIQNQVISREGLTAYQRNYRPVVYDVQQYAHAVGVAMLDSTVCDIYLINDEGNIVGRPYLTVAVDAFSSMCLGYTLTWEGGVYSLTGLMLNVLTDKVEHCKKFGITVTDEQWHCAGLPGVLVTDMGSEYKGTTFQQITELGTRIINEPSWRPDLKGPVEKLFDVVQSSYKKTLKGKGVIEPDFQQRGRHDYRLDACLTLNDFEKVIIYCLIYYNCQRTVDNFPYTREMIEDAVQPYASCIFNWNLNQMGADFIPVTQKQLVYTLLPRTTGRFSRKGLAVNKLRYHCEGFTEKYLKGETGLVAYNPADVSCVWLIEKGIYTRFELVETRFNDMDLVAVEEMKTAQRNITRRNNLQDQINLVSNIEAIAAARSNERKASKKHIRNTRKQEEITSHINYLNNVERR